MCGAWWAPSRCAAALLGQLAGLAWRAQSRRDKAAPPLLLHRRGSKAPTAWGASRRKGLTCRCACVLGSCSAHAAPWLGWSPVAGGEATVPCLANPRAQQNPDLFSSQAFKLTHLRPGTVSLSLSESDEDAAVQGRPGFHSVEFLITTGPGGGLLHTQRSVLLLPLDRAAALRACASTALQWLRCTSLACLALHLMCRASAAA